MLFSFYGFDNEMSMVDKGNGDLEMALRFLGDCLSHAGKKFEYGEDAVAETSFGISKGRKDFLEVTANGPGQVDFHSDRLCYKSTLSRLFNSKKRLAVSCNSQKAKDVICDYMTLDRQVFEEKYQDAFKR